MKFKSIASPCCSQKWERGHHCIRFSTVIGMLGLGHLVIVVQVVVGS